MTDTPLPARLLAFRDAAESTNDDEGNDGRATYVPVSLQTFRQTMEEAAAALSGGEAVAWTHDAENWGNALDDEPYGANENWRSVALFTTQPAPVDVRVALPKVTFKNVQRGDCGKYPDGTGWGHAWSAPIVEIERADWDRFIALLDGQPAGVGR